MNLGIRGVEIFGGTYTVDKMTSRRMLLRGSPEQITIYVL